MLKPRRCDEYNCSASTGIPNQIGDYRGPAKNSGPNPTGYWWGSVLISTGWRQVQEIGREATEKAMLALGADQNVVPIPNTTLIKTNVTS